VHNNYYFLKHLSKSLDSNLKGGVLVECFSQNKNELIIGFDVGGSDFYIKAHLKPTFCCLYFPENFSRANKNSVDLFSSLKNQKVSRVYQYLNERCFSIDFENGHKLLFKMHGNRSNIISYNAENTVIDVFNSKLKNDFQLSLDNLNRPIDQSKEAFFKENGELKTLFPTFGKVLKARLNVLNYSEKTIVDKWAVIQNILAELDKSSYYIIEKENILYLSLLPENGNSFKNPIKAINTFFLQYVKTASIRSLKKEVLSQIDRMIKQSNNYITKNKRRLEKVENQTNYSQLADIIMANLHELKTGAKKATLSNFYQNNEPVSIKLKENLSPQKNAENYYRKSKNQAKEIDNLKESIRSKQSLSIEYEIHREEIESFEDYKDLKKYIDKHDLSKKQLQKESKSLPFNEHSYRGYKIYVGNNAKNNDKMLQGYTSKDDLWLHAKDVSGSHVIIKQQPGKNFPKPVIEKAAQLAALNSKRKNDSLCPVIVTPRKYIRKRKGDPAGAVVVDKEEVILIQPL